MAGRLLVFFACIYLLVGSREPPWADAHIMYETTIALVDRHALDLNLTAPPVFFVVNKGKRYGGHALGNIVASIPAYLLYKGLSKIPQAPKELLHPLTAHLPATLEMAGACALFFLLALELGAKRRGALLVTLVLGLSTICLIYARQPYGEALQTLLLLWLVERVLALGRSPSVGRALLVGLSGALLINAKPVFAVVFPVAALYLAVQLRRDLPALGKAALFAALPLALGVGAVLLHNHVKTGSYTDPGYPPIFKDGFFTGYLPAGLFGFLLSPGKSVFLYSPPLILGLLMLPRFYRRAPGETLLVGGISLSLLLVYSKFLLWHGDYCWGPRFLVPIVPLLMLPLAVEIDGWLSAGRLARRRALVGTLVGAGLCVQLLGASLYWDHYIRVAVAVKDQTGAQGWFEHQLAHVHFMPWFSPLVGHAWLLKHLATQNPKLAEDAPWKSFLPAKVNLTDAWQRLRGDYWLADFAGASGSPALGSVLLTLFAAGAWFSGRDLLAEARG